MKLHLPTKAKVLLSLALCWLWLKSAQADIVGPSGSASVPGFPAGTKVHYRVGACQAGDRTAHFWLQVSNPHNAEIKFVICALLRLNKTPVATEHFTLDKTGDKWNCNPWPHAPEHTTRPPGFHFGCQTLTLASHAKQDAYDSYATFSESVCDSSGASALGAVYFDLLKYGEIVDGEQSKGRNKNLTPVGPAKEWIHLRAGHGGAIDPIIPTVSEWGVLLMASLLLTSGAALLLRRPAMRSMPGMPLRRAEATGLPWFARDVFRKALALMLALAGAGFTGIVWQWETISVADAAGTLLAVGMGTYWVHLLIVSWSDRRQL